MLGSQLEMGWTHLLLSTAGVDARTADGVRGCNSSEIVDGEGASDKCQEGHEVAREFHH